MLKQTLVISSILSLLLIGCSSDQRYKREVEGNEDYLKAAQLKPLVVPNGVTVPAESSEYYVFKAAKEGDVGKQLDIRPPALPLTNTADSYAYYGDGSVTLDAPEYSGFWAQIPTVLQNRNIAVERQDNSTIKTGVRVVNRGDEAQPIEASYLLQRKVQNGREYITIELASLRRMGQDISGSIDSQRYTVEFFNMLMNDLAATNKPSGS